ncbi:hypothetical protein BMNI_I0397 [Brucella melitensis NI]|nr:hypothetical protein BMNI_I0397 [Brucella melitensis NI]EXU83151.1 hypothetical protein AX23_08175 [Brucella melitensis 548]
MAAAMACNLVAFQMRLPDIVEPGGNLVAAERETDIGSARFLVRGLVAAAVLFGHQEDAGQEIGEMRVVFARKLA